MSFTPKISQRSKAERKLTDQQKQLLSRVQEFKGDAVKAARAVGYANPYEAVRSVKEELIEMAEDHLARMSIKSTMKLEEIMDSEYPITQAAEKLKAIFGVLDRTNPKTNKVDVTGEGVQPIFILPEKKELTDE